MEHSRPQSPSFLGHVVGKRGALEVAVTGRQKSSDFTRFVQEKCQSNTCTSMGFHAWKLYTVLSESNSTSVLSAYQP